MAAVLTTVLIQRVRQRADMLYDDFCTNAEIETYLSHAFRKFYNRLVAARDDQLLRSANETTLTITGGDVSMPPDFFKLLMVRLGTLPGGTDMRTLERRSPQQQFPNQTGRPTQYMLVSASNGPIVILVPTPDVSYKIEVVYVASFEPTGNTYPDVAGITDYMVIDAAIQCLDKEQSPTSVLRAERDSMLEQIIDTATPMDDGQPVTVVRQDQWNFGDFYDEGYFG